MQRIVSVRTHYKRIRTKFMLPSGTLERKHKRLPVLLNVKVHCFAKKPFKTDHYFIGSEDLPENKHTALNIQKY